jgi:hypothetical protein
MKTVLFGLTACLLAAAPAHAAVFTGTGTVYTVRSRDSTLGVNTDWFSLVGVTSLGTCPTADAGYVVLKMRDDTKGQRMLALALEAKAAGTTLTVQVDDTIRNSEGYCLAQIVY